MAGAQQQAKKQQQREQQGNPKAQPVRIRYLQDKRESEEAEDVRTVTILTKLEPEEHKTE